MSGNTNTTLEVTEKTDANADDFSNDVNEIFNHFDNGTMTKQTFTAFIDKMKIQINDYKQQLASFTKNKEKGAEVTSMPSAPKINICELINAAQLVASFNTIIGRAPKCKLSISFYPQFLALITQKKHDQHAIKTLINYSDIDRLVCVPEKNDDTLFYAKLNKKIPLNWKKSSRDSFVFAFQHSSDYEQEEEETMQLNISNLNTSLPAVITGNVESQFCRIISGLANKNIDRQDRNLYRTTFEKQKLFYFDANIKFNKCCVYPLRCGIFITPKPLSFTPQTRIKYYEYSRTGVGLRYFDLDIVLYGLDEDEKSDNKNKKKKKKDMISLTMIAKSEMNAIDHYFNCMKIKLKKDGNPSPDRKLNKNNNHNNKQEVDDDDEDDDENNMSPSDTDDDATDSEDDEEYKIEDDEYAYSDSNASDSDDDEEMDGDMDEDDDDDEDIDMNEVADVMKRVEVVERCDNDNDNKNKKRASKYRRKQKSPKKIVQKTSDKKKRNRKRKRLEMESDKNKEIITIEDNDSDGFDILQARKRFKGKIGKKTAIGRKSSVFGQKGAKIVSKSISKKKSPKKPRNKDERKDKSVEVIDLESVSPAKKRKKSSVNSSPRKIRSKEQSKKKNKNKKKNEKQRNLMDMFSKNES